MLLVKNGRVVDPGRKTDATLDILLDGDRIAEVAPAGEISSRNGFEVFDAGGQIVAPGFIDLHAHLREPGQESSETIETGTNAAARGGFTAVQRERHAIHSGSRKDVRQRSRLAHRRGEHGQRRRGDCRNRSDAASGDCGGQR